MKNPISRKNFLQCGGGALLAAGCAGKTAKGARAATKLARLRKKIAALKKRIADSRKAKKTAKVMSRMTPKQADKIILNKYGKYIDPKKQTGDLAQKDEDGYIWFKGRTDDLITSSGYRIGPSEIEDCLAKHGAVAMAAVIGAPDPVRGDIVKAFIVPAPGVTPGPELEQEIKDFVKTRLSPHEYPRAIEFMEELPLTATGKIMRRELRKREVEKEG